MKTKNIVSLNREACLFCQAKYIAGRYNVNIGAYRLLCEKRQKQIVAKPLIATSNRPKI